MKMFKVTYNANKKALFWPGSTNQQAKGIAATSMAVWTASTAMVLETDIAKANSITVHPCASTYTFETFIELFTTLSANE